MSSEQPISTWKCKTCGTVNRFANPSCVLCNNPRPADVAMPPGGAAQPSATPMEAPTTPTGPSQPAQTQAVFYPRYETEQPQAMPAGSRGIPPGLIALAVYEVILLVYALYNTLIVTPRMFKLMQHSMGGASQPPGFSEMMKVSMGIGLAIGLVWLGAKGLMVLGWFMRWSFTRVAGIVRYVLAVINGVTSMAGAGIMLFAMSTMKQTGAHGNFSMPGMSKFMPHPGTSTLLALVGLCVGVFGIWYLTTDTVKRHFSD